MAFVSVIPFLEIKLNIWQIEDFWEKFTSIVMKNWGNSHYSTIKNVETYYNINIKEYYTTSNNDGESF